MNCTRCNATGFLNTEYLPEGLLEQGVEVILKWIADHLKAEVQVCDCCGDGEEWYGTPGENITQPMTRLVTTARMPTTEGFVNATKKKGSVGEMEKTLKNVLDYLENAPQVSITRENIIYFVEKLLAQVAEINPSPRRMMG